MPHPLWTTVWHDLAKVKISLILYEPALSFPDIHPGAQREYVHQKTHENV